MAILIVAFCVIVAIFVKIKTGDWLNPGTIFLAYLGFIVLMASLRLYDLAETSQAAYSMILLGVISYFIGSILGTSVTFKTGNLSLKGRESFYNINYKFLLIAECIVIAYSCYRLLTIAQLLVGGNSWWEIRLMATSGESGVDTLKGGTISNLIYECAAAPLAYLIAPTLVVDLIVGKRKKHTIIIGILSMVTFSLSTVSRAIWTFTIIYIVSVVLLYRKKYNLTPKQKRMLKFSPVLIAIVFFVIVQISNMRNSETDILQNAYAYISGALPLLSIHLESNISQIRTYGMLSLFGFLYPLLFVLNYIHVLPYTQTYFNVQAIKDNLEVFRSIGNGVTMNAYSTLFYDFYIDFGMIGVALGSLFFGYLCMRSFCNFKRKADMRNLVLYLILLQFIIFSMARIYTIYATRALTLIWIIPMFARNLDRNGEVDLDTVVSNKENGAVL